MKQPNLHGAVKLYKTVNGIIPKQLAIWGKHLGSINQLIGQLGGGGEVA